MNKILTIFILAIFLFVGESINAQSKKELRKQKKAERLKAAELSNNSYRLYGELISSGQVITVSGSAITSGSNKSTLTLTQDDGTVDTYTITKINGSSVSFNGTNAGQVENIVLIRM